MQTSRGPTLDETIAFIKKAGTDADKNAARQHLENLLYMKSVLYLDDKQNEKHLSRTQAVLEALKTKYSKELSEVATTDGTLSLVAQILTANKIIDGGIARLKALIEKGTAGNEGREAPLSAVSQTGNVPKAQGSTTASPTLNPHEVKDNPKLRETLGFLVSIVGDPLRTTTKIPEHLSNLEKISKLIKREYQDPKIQKINDNILGILGKIFGEHGRKELNQALDNSIKILKNLPQYKILIGLFETDVKHYLSQAQAEHGGDMAPSARQLHVEKFYAQFKDEKNMVKKINMVKNVLTSTAYKYDKELNAASLKLLKGLEVMGLQVEVIIPGSEKNH